MADAPFSISVIIDNPELLQEALNADAEFKKGVEKTFLNTVFEIHKYLIRVTPIDTGQLRGGWTSFLDKFNEDYSQQLYDIALADKAPGREYHISPEGVQEGKGHSSFEFPAPLDVTLTNSVPYGIFLEEGTSRLAARNFVELAKYKGEFWFQKLMEDWFSQIANAGKVVQPGDSGEEIPA